MPCYKHQNNIEEPCDCLQIDRGDRYLDIYVHNGPVSQEEFERQLRNPKFCGIVCASVTPPQNLWHPLLMTYDNDLDKSVASNRPIKFGYWPSPIFKKALEIGYRIDALHRYDEYHCKPSLWRDIMLDLFLEKMINSKVTPQAEQAERLVAQYSKKFGKEFGDKVAATIRENKWGKNEAKKQTAKVMMNSAWGKHAQRANMPKSIFVHHDTQEDKEIDFFEKCTDGLYQFEGEFPTSNNSSLYKYTENLNIIQPDLHGGYLPAALFVTCYGQLQLWTQMNKIDSDPNYRRVLMCDTDSIVYIYDPECYNIPEGSLLGEWEVEDEDKENGGIREFVGMGPKTYGFRCENGYTKVKAKGLSLNYATRNLVNFEKMKEQVVHYLNTGSTLRSILVPQRTFQWHYNSGMKTMPTLKEFKFNFDDMKGVINRETACIHPFGFIQ